MANDLAGTEIVRAKDLKPRMRIFADEWLTGKSTGKRFNGFAAARYAEYPEQYATRLLRHPKVKAYIEQQLEAHAMSTMEIIARFTDIARSSPGEVVRISEDGKRLELDMEKVIENKPYIKNFGFDANLNPKIEFHDAHAALRDLARVRGLLKDGLEVSGVGGGAVPVAMLVQFVAPDGTGLPLQPEMAQIEGPQEDFSDVEEYEPDPLEE